MTVEADPYDPLAEALRELVGRFGASAFGDRRRLISLLSDKLPESRREIRLVGTAIDEGVPAALAAAERPLVGMEMDRQASRLESAAGLRPDLARSIVRAFAYALDLGPPPSLYRDWSAPAPPPAPTPGADAGWAGISAPVAPNPGNTGHHPPAPYTGQPSPWSAPEPPPPTSSFAGIRLEQKHMLGVAGAAVLVIGGFQLLSGGSDTPGNVTEPVVTIGNETAPDPRREPVSTAAGSDFAGELQDLGVPAKAELEPNVGSATPLEIPVGTRVTTGELQKLLARDSSALLVDVLDNPHPTTIRNAVYLPAAGKPGTFDDQNQKETAAELRRLVAGKPDRPIVFFCMGAYCWESYNAVLRANSAGYRNLYWYRGGLASWNAAGLPMQPLQAPQQGGAGLF